MLDRLVLAALSTYRLARLIALEDGPSIPSISGRTPILAHIRREVATLDLDPDTGEPRYDLQELVKCPYCLGVWLAPLLIALSITPLWFILLPLAASGLHAFLLDLASPGTSSGKS